MIERIESEHRRRHIDDDANVFALLRLQTTYFRRNGVTSSTHIVIARLIVGLKIFKTTRSISHIIQTSSSSSSHNPTVDDGCSRRQCGASLPTSPRRLNTFASLLSSSSGVEYVCRRKEDVLEERRTKNEINDAAAEIEGRTTPYIRQQRRRRCVARRARHLRRLISHNSIAFAEKRRRRERSYNVVVRSM